MIHLTANDLIALGVALNLLASLAKAVFKTPKQQTQVIAIESKVDDVLTHVVQYLPVAPTPAAPTPAPTQPTTAPGGGS